MGTDAFVRASMRIYMLAMHLRTSRSGTPSLQQVTMAMSNFRAHIMPTLTGFRGSARTCMAEHNVRRSNELRRMCGGTTPSIHTLQVAFYVGQSTWRRSHHVKTACQHGMRHLPSSSRPAAPQAARSCCPGTPSAGPSLLRPICTAPRTVREGCATAPAQRRRQPRAEGKAQLGATSGCAQHKAPCCEM